VKELVFYSGKSAKDIYLIFRQDGRIYEGMWHQGLQHGIGYFKEDNLSEARKGLWEKGIRV